MLYKTSQSGVIHQGRLKQVVDILFPGIPSHSNSRKGSSLASERTGRWLEVDVWLPGQRLAFEFQDLYHYITTWYAQTPLSHVQYNDSAKREVLRKKEVDLVEVPCWWEGDPESLKSTVEFQRPDIIESFDQLVSGDQALPIPLNPPHDFFKSPEIPDVGELMLASFPVEFRISESVSSSNPWWMGEKYDGVRICWNPMRNAIFSRSGLQIYIHKPYVSQFPPLFIDGEIWFGRGYFNHSQRVVSSNDYLLDSMRIPSFDTPYEEWRNESFELRYKKILSNIPEYHPFLILATRLLCTSSLQMEDVVSGIQAHQGEGLILRLPGSLYVSGRSPFLLKVKVAQGDREGIVVKITDKQSVILKLPDGKSFMVPCNQVQVNILQLVKGDVVTFSYSGHSRNAIPINAYIYKVRTDISWEQVQLNYLRGLPPTSSETSQPMRFWTTGKGKDMRAFLEKFARNKGLDPFVPETWYTITRSDIEKIKGGNSILMHFKSYASTVMHLFPELNLDETKFASSTLSTNWHTKTRRKWFDAFASRHNMDPLIPQNWYSFKLSNIFDAKGGQVVLSRYNSDPVQALVHLYPEIELDKFKFTIPSVKWKHIGYMKQFFHDYARDHKFDPLMANNWYNVTTSIYKYKGVSHVLQYFQRSISKALLYLFPHIGLDLAKFENLPKKYWQDYENQRDFFIKFAQDKGFDAHNPENWYLISKQELTSKKGGTRVLMYHNGSIAKAIINLFPEMGAIEAKFKKHCITIKHQTLTLANNQKSTIYWPQGQRPKYFFRNLAKLVQ